MVDDLIVPDVWLCQPDEPRDAYRAFCVYRDQGHRDIGAVPGRTEKVTAWSKQYGWRARVLAFDNHLQNFEIVTRKEALQQKVLNIALRDVAIIDEAQKLVLREIQAHLAKALSAEFDAETPSMPMKDVRALMELCAKYTRLLTGQATERIEVENYDDMSIDKLRELQEKNDK